MAGPLMITDAEIDGALKNVYASFRVNSFPILTVLLANIKRGKSGGAEHMQWGGNGVFWDVVLSRPTGMSADQLGFLPPHAQATEKQANLGIKRTYVTREADNLALVGTESKEAAFIPFARKIVKEQTDAARLGQQEILHGDGRGIKGLITVTNTTTSFTVSSPYGIAGAGEGGLLLDVGMFIAILDTSAADAILGTATITAVVNTGDAAVLTIDTAIAGQAVGDKIVQATSATRTSFGQVPSGLINILNTGAAFNLFQGIDGAVYTRWNSTRLPAPDPAQPNELDVWELATKVSRRSGKDAKTRRSEFLLMTTDGLEKKLAESFLGQRRWEASSQAELKGGFTAINLNGLNLVSDSFTPAGTVYLLHLPSLVWVDRMDWAKVQHEDSGAWRFIAGRDAYQTTIASYWNFGCLQRNAHGLINGYTDTARFSHAM